MLTVPSDAGLGARVSFLSGRAAREGFAKSVWPVVCAVLVSLVLAKQLWSDADARKSTLDQLAWVIPDRVSDVLIDWQSKANQAPFYQSSPVAQDISAHIHAATAVETQSGQINVFWYGGTREGAKDVQIFQAIWDAEASIWSEPHIVTGPRQLSYALDRYIKKVGNPLALRATNGDIWLVFVSVSIGGWAGSQLNWMVSKDEGATWSEPKHWITSPFFNISTLVKTAAQLYQTGWVGIPIYHEFIGKFSEYLLVDAEGRIHNKVRMDWGRDNLQPLVLPTSSRNANAYLRYAGDPPNQLLVSESSDAGMSWRVPRPIKLPNPDASVTGLVLSRQEQLLVFNNSPTDRSVLSLAYSKDQGRTWSVLYDFERREAGAGDSYSYPVLIKVGHYYHLFYSHTRQHIQHVYFDDAWLARRILDKSI